MKSRWILGSLAFLAAVSVGQFSTAELIVITSNNIDGTNPSTATPYTTNMFVGAGVSSTLTQGIAYNTTGLTGGNDDNVYSTRGWDSNALDPNDYLSFVIAPVSGGSIDFSEFTYNATVGKDGPTSFQLYYGLVGQNNFTLVDSIQSLNPTIDLSGISTTSQMEFRLYAWGAKNSGDIGEFAIDNYSFSGFTTAVPEPTSLLLTGMAVGGLALRRRRS